MATYGLIFLKKNYFLFNLNNILRIHELHDSNDSNHSLVLIRKGNDPTQCTSALERNKTTNCLLLMLNNRLYSRMLVVWSFSKKEKIKKYEVKT
jgi:hypothetical protein